MRALKLISFAVVISLSSSLIGQLSIHLNLTPSHERRSEVSSSVNYYYLPDVEAYYDIHTSRYIYFDGRVWIRSSRLPGRYGNYDMDRGRKVVIRNYRGSAPYSQIGNHRKMYGKGYRVDDDHQHRENINAARGGHFNDKKNERHGGGGKSDRR